MGTFSIWHWLIVLAVVLILFGGGGKITQIMGDFGKGLKSFKKGMKEDDEEEGDAGASKPLKTIKSDSPPASSPAPSPEKNMTAKD